MVSLHIWYEKADYSSLWTYATFLAFQVKGCSSGFLQKRASSRWAAKDWCHNQLAQSKQGTKEGGRRTVNVCGVWTYWGGLSIQNDANSCQQVNESRPTASVHGEARFWSADRQCQHAEHVFIVVKPIRQAPVPKIRLSWSSYKKRVHWEYLCMDRK